MDVNIIQFHANWKENKLYDQINYINLTINQVSQNTTETICLQKHLAILLRRHENTPDVLLLSCLTGLSPTEADSLSWAGTT